MEQSNQRREGERRKHLERRLEVRLSDTDVADRRHLTGKRQEDRLSMEHREGERRAHLERRAETRLYDDDIADRRHSSGKRAEDRINRH